MSSSVSGRLQPPPMEKVIFWAVSLLLVAQMTWWISFQVKESRRLLEAQNREMRAGRAQALQEDFFVILGADKRQERATADKRGPEVTVMAQSPRYLPMEERISRIEAKYPYVAVVEEAQEDDDPTLLDYPTLLEFSRGGTSISKGAVTKSLYVTLRKDVLAQMEHTRRMGLWRIGLQAAAMVTVIFLGLAYIYRRLSVEMELMLRQRNFIAAVTHELKTPIASLRVWIETLFTHELPETRKVRVQKLMDGDLTRLTELVSNLLEVARADAGHLEVLPERVEMAPWIRKVCEAMDHRLGQGQLGLTLALEEELWADIDPRLFATVLENLLSNAFKYASEPRETHVLLLPDGEDLVITVSDRGRGFAAREASRLFQRFYRVGDEMTRQVAGTGLGLFLTREIVSRHRGTIRASSLGPGLGATFTVRIPRLPR